MKQATTNYQLFFDRTEYTFALPLPRLLRALLDYYEFSIASDLGPRHRDLMENKRHQKNILSDELVSAIKSMSKQERIDSYLQITDYTFMLAHGRTNFLLQNKEDGQLEGYVRLNTDLSWKKRILTYDRINHILSITDPITLSAKTCNLAYYLYRISKNEEYKGFVLEASDKRVNKHCRTVHVGFKSQASFDDLAAKVKESVSFRQW